MRNAVPARLKSGKEKRGMAGRFFTAYLQVGHQIVSNSDGRRERKKGAKRDKLPFKKGQGKGRIAPSGDQVCGEGVRSRGGNVTKLTW